MDETSIIRFPGAGVPGAYWSTTAPTSVPEAGSSGRWTRPVQLRKLYHTAEYAAGQPLISNFCLYSCDVSCLAIAVP